MEDKLATTEEQRRMAIEKTNALEKHLAEMEGEGLLRGLTRPPTAVLQQESIDHAADLRKQCAEMRPQARGVAIVAAELEHAQEQAARVKPLREELDRLLGRKSRARKAVQK